jgi:hypothetical protein
MKALFSMFSEDEISLSMVRVMCFLSLVVGCVLAYLHYDTSLVGTLIGSAFSAKIAQKHLETRADMSDVTTPEQK